MQRGSGRQTRFIRGVSGPCLGTGNNCTCFQVAFACVLCLGQRAGCGRKRRCLLWLCFDQRHCHRRHCCNVYGRCKRRSSLRCSRSGGGEGNIRPGNPGPIEQRHAVPPLSLHSSPQPQPPHVQLRSPHSQRSPQSPQLRPRNSHPATSRVPAPRLRLSPPNNPRPNRPSRPRPPRRSRLQPPPPSRSFADSKPSCHGRRQAAPRRTCGCRCTAAERRDSLVLHQPVTALAAASASHGARSVTALATAAIMTRIPHEAVLNPRPGPPLPQPCAPKCRDASRHGRRRPCRWCLYHASHYTKHYIMRRLLDANYATHYATAALPWRHPHRREAFSNGSLTADRPGRRLGGRGAVDGREPEVGDSDAAAPGA